MVDHKLPPIVSVAGRSRIGKTTFLVKLIAELTGTPLEPVVLGPYQKTLAGVRGLPSTLTVNWKNLYTLPTQNFITVHTLTPLPK